MGTIADTIRLVEMVNEIQHVENELRQHRRLQKRAVKVFGTDAARFLRAVFRLQFQQV